MAQIPEPSSALAPGASGGLEERAPKIATPSAFGSITSSRGRVSAASICASVDFPERVVPTISTRSLNLNGSIGCSPAGASSSCGSSTTGEPGR